MVSFSLMESKGQKILVVEDEGDIRELLSVHLTRMGYVPTGAETGEKGAQLLKSDIKWDLLVLDWMLPGISGLELCRMADRRVPVLMVTAKAEAEDIVAGLEAGADDYITKPFEVPVFLARVKALLRRRSAGQATERCWKVGDLSVSVEKHEVICGGSPLKLTVSEFKLLTTLLENNGKVLSREALIEKIQGQGIVVVDRAIDTHVFGLRKKLGPCAEVVETIRGVGYRVRPVETEGLS